MTTTRYATAFCALLLASAALTQPAAAADACDEGDTVTVKSKVEKAINTSDNTWWVILANGDNPCEVKEFWTEVRMPDSCKSAGAAVTVTGPLSENEGGELEIYLATAVSCE